MFALEVKTLTHQFICFLITYSNCFSTKPNNSVHVCATRLYHDNEEEADDETHYRKKSVENQQKDYQDIKTTIKTTSWNKHEPCRNGHHVTTCCKQEPSEPDATSGYKQEQLATILCKMKPEEEQPVLNISIVLTKRRICLI